jgi:uncharacterized caspase-like protein
MKMNFPRWRVPCLIFLCLLAWSFVVRGQSTPPQGQAQGNDKGIGAEMARTPVEWPAGPKRFALIIGVDHYDDTQITTLGGASNDAKALKDALVRYAGFGEEQVTLLASDQPPERQPTRGNILRRLSNLKGVVPKEGLLLVAFSGHGIEREQQAFLLPQDSQVSNDVELLEQTAINVTQIKAQIKKLGLAQVVMILDACRNDPGGRAEADNPLTKSFTRGFDFDVRNREVEAFATLYATAVGHRAYEYTEKKQGYFTWALVEGLKGGAANTHGEVTLASLVGYLQDRVPKRVQLDLGAGKEQRPFAVIEGYRADELVVASVGRKPSAFKEQNIRRLLEITKAAELGAMAVNQQLDYLKTTLPAGVPPRVFEILKDEVNAVNFVELMIPIYDKNLSDDEVNDLVSFYESPLGHKMIQIMPVIFNEARVAGEQRGQEAAQRALTRIKAEKLLPDK